ncbi:MAG: phospho-sugar mutase [candidate division Zixibacteria bacterium]|nr:phospho-sugar mutase [candidate division Zixibacteria bacterium]
MSLPFPPFPEGLSAEATAGLERWTTDLAYAAFRDAIRVLLETGSLDEIEDAFRTRIEFGTGGIRGRMGPGPNRINTRTIGEAAQGLALYVRKAGGADAAQRGVVIAYDTRIDSDLFGRETACIIAGNGIVAYLFDDCRATPELSFAVREIGAVAGVVISASHNPPSDNGFKGYWSDGGQVVPPHDKNIIAQVRTVGEIRRVDFEQALRQGTIRRFGSEIDARYVQTLAALSLSEARNVRIVYTPLHGVGMSSVGKALERLGYRDVHIVEEQAVQDGRFPTVERGVANPEDPAALELAVRKAAQIDADIVLASDPDADRIGCALPLPEKGWNAPPNDLALNGNQIGVALCHYILTRKKEMGLLPSRGLVCKTVVTTDLTSLIARSFGMDVVENLLVGFKYIGAVIDRMAEGMGFVFGTEESHGYLADARIRDKEAATGVLLAECVATLKTEGRTLRDYLDDIYREYGYFREIQKSLSREGASGAREIAGIMKRLRESPPSEIGGYKIFEVIDRQSGQALCPETGVVRTVEGDRGNILIFTFTQAGHTRVTARPSGTEPKIKYYVSASSADHPHLISGDLSRTRVAVDGLAEEIIKGMMQLRG